ncbi:glycosyltransferase [Staphylococcus devriesei]|uniref:glycosyltransferase n=1 Tax=Staphylococcus devriesei TaxID=586733 RepID=UPI001F3BCC47|nr:glycosyltransferase [Staphylococcus devriesei]MCE5090620.1 glycosyltransferase [Staphylococcus devriesei]
MLYTITSTLPPVHGGRTKALLYRIKFLEEKLNEPSTILTTNYNANYKNVYKIFRRKGFITDNLKLDNMYDWLANYKLLEEPTTPSFVDKVAIKSKIKVLGLKAERHGDDVSYYKAKTRVMFTKYYKDSDVIKYEDTIIKETSNISKRKEYTLNGKLHKITYYDEKTTFKFKEEYYDRKGKMYLNKSFNNNEDNKLIEINYFKKKNKIINFKNEKALFTYYYNQVLKDGSIVFNDARLLDRSLIECKNNIKRILVFHSNHFITDKIRKSYQLALEKNEAIDKYIVLTDYQKNDIQSQFAINDDKIDVIPHFLDIVKAKTRENVQDQFCFIGRIAKEKQIDHIIRAFDIYLKKGYTSKLLIYGNDKDGSLKKLKKLVAKLNIKDNVKFKGHTDQPEKVFDTVKASLLTSQYEGFALTVMESINTGCPVVSYNMRYGPSELITNGENGILVEKDNIESFANGIEMARNKDFKDVKLSTKFDTKKALENYQALLDDITNT